MAHFEKFKGINAFHMIEHDTRENTKGKENIDEERSKLNYNLCDVENPKEYLKELIQMVKDTGGTIRNDTNFLVSLCLTLPEDFPQNEELEKQFFKAAVELIENDFGYKSIVSAWVHKDESLENENFKFKPHIHIKFAPIHKKIKKYKSRPDKEMYIFNTDKCINRTYLRQFHNRLDSHIEEWLGFKTSVHTGITKAQGGNKEIKELKAISEQLKKNRNIIDKDSDLIVAEQKQILDNQWKQYQDLTRTTWNQLTPIRNRIKDSIWELKKGDATAEKQLRKDLDFWGNLANGLLYALSSLLNGLFLISRKKYIEKQLNELQVLYDDIESVRRIFSNQQHSVKKNLMSKDLDKIETTLNRLEATSIATHELIKEVLWRRPEIQNDKKVIKDIAR